VISRALAVWLRKQVVYTGNEARYSPTSAVLFENDDVCLENLRVVLS
jgi:hypothetical protein